MNGNNQNDLVDIVATVRIHFCAMPSRQSMGFIEYADMIRAIIEDAVGYCDDGIEIQSIEEISCIL